VSPTPFNPATITADGDITLVLGRRTTTSVAGHRVRLHNDVVTELRAMCDATLSSLGARDPVPYADDLNFDADTHYMVAETTALVTHVPERRRGRRRADEPPERPLIETDAAAHQVLANASSQPLVDAAEVERRKSFLFSAAVVGDDPTERVAFVSAHNPYRSAERGRLVTLFGDGLRRVTEPLLIFRPDFDMVVTSGYVAILRPEAFEKVFREIDRMKARIPVWSAALTRALPVSSESAERIERLCQQNARVARHVRSMYERGVLGTKFEVTSLRRQLQQQGLDPNRLIKHGKLVLEEDDIPDVLKVLDERLYIGWHSSTNWDVGTRAPRRA
jgi:hypothetical protein